MVDTKLPALFVDAYNKKCPSSFMKMGMRVYLCNCGQGVYPNPMRITKPQGFGLAVCCFGGDKRDRTADLLNAIQALSQLSYTPICPKAVAPQLLLDFLLSDLHPLMRVALLVICAPS